MAWNDPPSFDYQQLPNTGKKFKHRYVNSVTNLGQQQQSQFMQQTSTLQPATNIQHQQTYQSHNIQPDSYPQPPTNSYPNQNVTNYALGSNYTSTSANQQEQMFSMPPILQQPFPPQTHSQQQ